MTDDAITHREPIAALAVHLDDHDTHHDRDTAGPRDVDVIAVVVSAIYPDGSAAAIPAVDLRLPTAGLDEHGRTALSVDQADALADTLTTVAATARRGAQR